MFVVVGTRLKCLAPPQDLLPPFDAGQVPSRPPNTPTMHFLPHFSPFPSQAHSPEMHFLEVFLARAGTSGQKGAFPPSPHLLFCVCSGAYPPNPPAPPMPLLVSPFPLKFILCTLTPLFSLCHLGSAVILFYVAEGPQAPSEVQQVPQLPLYPLALHLYPNLFSFSCASQSPGLHILLPFFHEFLRRIQHGTFRLALPFSSCVLSAQDLPPPICTTNFPTSLPTPTEMPPLH